MRNPWGGYGDDLGDFFWIIFRWILITCSSVLVIAFAVFLYRLMFP